MVFKSLIFRSILYNLRFKELTLMSASMQLSH